MNTLNKRSRAALLAAVALVALGAAAAVAQKQLAARATGRPEIKVTLSGAVARGEDSVALDKAGSVHPGEVLDWKITSANEGDGAARQYKTVGHVPQGTSFVAGSATAEYGAEVSYSIDNGKSFAAQPTVEEKQADGTVKRVPAPVSMYTEVRYEWADPLAASSTLTANYKVRVK
ncbi:MAG: hypothetical protein LC785_02915 [Acidobacteria bacterium]|nr:hypothetical protein [Acidobacteriota bacterium]MCA1640936.1 hypothetical protein [Acidobacteriota bacterium]